MVPYALPKARWGYRMDVTGKGELLDLMVYDGLFELFYGYHMGLTAENIAAKYGISREDQDKLGAPQSPEGYEPSHQSRAFSKREIVPVTIPQRKGDPITFDTDRETHGD